MGPHVWLTSITCVGELVLAGAAFFGGARSGLGLPLALLSLDLFGWNFASLAFELSHRPSWRWFDLAVSPLTAPLLLHFVLAFVGRARRLRALLAACYVGFAALALSAVVAWFFPFARGFPGSRQW